MENWTSTKLKFEPGKIRHQENKYANHSLGNIGVFNIGASQHYNNKRSLKLPKDINGQLGKNKTKPIFYKKRSLE